MTYTKEQIIEAFERLMSDKQQTDAPICPNCGTLMQRSGSCHTCPECGQTSGCS